jgi:hypothetical protein
VISIIVVGRENEERGEGRGGEEREGTEKR